MKGFLRGYEHEGSQTGGKNLELSFEFICYLLAHPNTPYNRAHPLRDLRVVLSGPNFPRAVLAD